MRKRRILFDASSYTYCITRKVGDIWNLMLFYKLEILPVPNYSLRFVCPEDSMTCISFSLCLENSPGFSRGHLTVV